jgi:thiamine-monophosphate kinase
VAKSEDSFVAWLGSRAPSKRPGVLVGIGDDMAVLKISGSGGKAAKGRGARMLVTADMLMDGVDFDASVHSPEQIGRKALAASFSDCAAMAVQPRYVMVSVALPEEWSMAQAKRLYRGIEKLAAAYGCAIVGGDTNSWRHPLAIDVIVIAEPWQGIEPVRRNGMRPGDAVCVTGTLGGSLAAPPHRGEAGVPHHLGFTPRVREGHWLAAGLGKHLHAMMDLSDGLSTDAARMAAAAKCGIEFDSAALECVVSEAAVVASQTDYRSVLDHLLNDGEDFELLFAVDRTGLSKLRQSDVGEIEEMAQPPSQWTKIGVAIKGSGVWLRRDDGRRERIESRGWQHFKDA